MAKKPQQKKISYKGKDYVGTLKGGTVAVKVNKTANGQLLNAGSYNVSTNEWQNGSKNCPLPDFVKREIEKAF